MQLARCTIVPAFESGNFLFECNDSDDGRRVDRAPESCATRNNAHTKSALRDKCAPDCTHETILLRFRVEVLPCLLHNLRLIPLQSDYLNVRI